MKSYLLLFTVALHLTALATGPVKIIFDTDMGNDIDDALALAMIHALEDRAECELLAVTITKDHPLAAPYVDALNHFYGRGDIPIGIVKDGVSVDSKDYLSACTHTENGKLKYPHDLLPGDAVEDATLLLRKILARQDDQSVVFVQVGFFTNLARLLESEPDEISPMSGKELVAKKVRYVSVMAGKFHFHSWMGYRSPEEFNVEKDIESAQTVVETCPVEIVFSGFEIGRSLAFPVQNIQTDFNYVPDHILKVSFFMYTDQDRPTWDLTSVLEAVRSERNYFEYSRNGTVSVGADGSSQFATGPQGKHRYLVLQELQKPYILQTMIDLASQPPAQPAGL